MATKKQKKESTDPTTTFTWLIVLVLFVFLAYTNFTLSQERDYITSSLVVSNKYIHSLETASGLEEYGSQHTHADFRLFINGEYVDLNSVKYTADEFLSDGYWQSSHNKLTHLHAGEFQQDVMHVHAKGLTYKQFFNSVGIQITHECLEWEGKKYCSNSERSLKFYRNGQRDHFLVYRPINDLDRVLISYGDETAKGVLAQFKTVSFDSCYSSKNCKEE